MTDAPKSSGRWWPILILWGGLALLMGLGLISIHIPFGRDQGVSAYVAEVMARGGAVYRDVYHFNLPAIFFVYRLARLLPLPWVEAVNLTHLIFLALTLLAIHRAARQVLSPLASSLAALLYGAFAVIMYTTYWNIAQKESLAALPLALALWFALRLDRDSAPSLLDALLGGLFTGAAAQFKPTLGIIFLVFLLPAWRRRKNKKQAIGLLAASTAGAALSFVPLVWHLTAHGLWTDLINGVLRFGGFYGGQAYHGFFGTLRNVIWNLAKWLYEWRFLTALAAAGLAAAKTRGERNWSTVSLFGLLLLVQIIAQMKFFTYHWIPLLLPLALLAARGAQFLIQDQNQTMRRLIVLALVALFLGNLLPETGRYRREYLYDRHQIDRASFLAPYGRWGGGDMCPLASQAVADYLDQHTRPDDPVLVFGLEPGIYVLAQRFPPTRFAYDQPLVTDPKGNASFAEYRVQMRKQFMADLTARPPCYVVVIENDATSIEAADSYTQMKDFTEFHDFIDQGYELETKIEDYFMFRRLDRGAGASR